MYETMITTLNIGVDLYLTTGAEWKGRCGSLTESTPTSVAAICPGKRSTGDNGIGYTPDAIETIRAETGRKIPGANGGDNKDASIVLNMAASAQNQNGFCWSRVIMGFKNCTQTQELTQEGPA